MSVVPEGLNPAAEAEAAGRILFRSARRLHHAVERDEDGAGQLTHSTVSPASAASILATSILRIVIIASNARLAAALSGLSSPRAARAG